MSFTFAVLGDNRGDSHGGQPPVFAEIIRAVNEANPDLVLHVGDTINGYAGEDEAHLRRLWRGYRDAVAHLKAPLYHAPGNHDVFDDLSAALWRELWGPTYHAFDHGGACFIVLDTETAPNRLGEMQHAWLMERLDGAADRPTFIVMHRPLFPVNGHRGRSLDVYPEERDRLHRLFASRRAIIKGVFQGHEHLYHFEQRDGVPYYILGGGGEELYVPVELGGFYHFLLVTVDGSDVQVEVRRAGETSVPSRPAITAVPGALLEDWRSTLFWYSWDHSVVKELTGDCRSEDRHGLKVSFDLSRCDWPMVLAPLTPPRDLTGAAAICLDIFMPAELAGLCFTLTLAAGDSCAAPEVTLKPGWNPIAIELDDSWLPPRQRRAVCEVQLSLSAPSRDLVGWVVFDNFRAEPIQKACFPSCQGSLPLTELRETWQGQLLWGVWDQAVAQAPAPFATPRGGKGVKIGFDLAKFDRPVLFAAIQPARDLSQVGALLMDVFQPETLPAPMGVTLSLTSEAVRYPAPAVLLRPGWNQLAVALDETWLAEAKRTAVDHIELAFAAPAGQAFAGWLVLGEMRWSPKAAGERRR